MKKLYKISIIIPLYNVEDYIEECLQSIISQTYKGELECIIVNDCGNDNSLSIIQHFISSYKGAIEFKIVHHDRNRGLSAARNTGVRYATGNYVYFLDSDDYISTDCIEVLTEPLKDRDYDMVVGDVEMFGNTKEIDFLCEDKNAILGNIDIFKHWYVERSIYVMAWNKLTKTTLFKEYDLTFLEGQLHEDELWTYKIASHIESVAISKKRTYFYRIRENSITSKNSHKVIERYKSCYKTLEYVITHKANVDEQYYQTCVIYYFGVMLRNTFEANFDFYKDYAKMRNAFEYNPIKLFYNGKLSLKNLKKHIHFCVPPRLGYIYLKLKYIKQNLFK